MLSLIEERVGYSRPVASDSLIAMRDDQKSLISLVVDLDGRAA